RRGWLLLAQLMIIIALIWMASTDPALGEKQIRMMAFAVVLLAFSAATQDISVDAWRIEAADEKDIGILSSLYIVGYRIGMILSGAGALFLVNRLGSSAASYSYGAWRMSYLIMAATMLIGVLTTLKIKEPQVTKDRAKYQTRDYLAIILIFIIAILSFIVVYKFTGIYKGGFSLWLSALFHNSILATVIVSIIQLTLAFTVAILTSVLVYRLPWTNRTMTRTIYITPVIDLLQRHKTHAWLLIGIICTYRISDIVMGVSANLFYQYMGFNLGEIAGIVKTFGLIMTLTGGLLGGFAVVKYGVLRIMIVGAILSAATNLLFMVMAETGKSIEFLVILISADNLSAGLALTAFVGFLSLMVNRSFTAVQYAMFSSVMTLFPKILGGFSGGMIEAWGYSQFFLMTTIIGIPVVLMLIYADKKQCFRLVYADTTKK
ncbi:AmpG permease, partial [hydrothermal vent metagenome]